MLVLEEMFARPDGGWRCTRCKAQLDWPGLCEACAGSITEGRSTIATIPRRFAWATWGNPLVADRCGAEAVASASTALESIRSRKRDCIVLVGRAGCGKTSLACAILDACRESARLAFSPRYASLPSLANARRDAALGRPPEALQDALRASVCVLDDLGQSRWDGDVVLEILQARHDGMLPSVITTALEQREVHDRYGGGVARRIYERASVIRMGGAT